VALIWAFSREAGGAEVLAPVIKVLKKKHKVVLLTKDFAKDIFVKHSLPFAEIDGYSPSLIQHLIKKYGRPSLVLTSAVSFPWRDMTEKYLWKWSAEKRIPSIAILDQWHNYVMRFSGAGKNERLKYLPDYVCVMDEHAKKDMIREDIPKTKIVVTGQPAFDSISQCKKTFLKEKYLKIRKKLGVKDEKMILFVGEALKREYGNSLGYTEVTTLRAVLDTLKKLTCKNFKFFLVVKLHPQNKKEDFKDMDFDKYRSKVNMKFIRGELPRRDLVLCSDVVIGMSSVLLVESILLGKPTLSLQINAKRDDLLIATRIGAIPLLANIEDFERALRSILVDKKYLAEYLGRQRRLSTDGQATKRVAQFVEAVLKKSG
jgi:hypothetical protein